MAVWNSPGYYHAMDATFTADEHEAIPPISLETGEEWKTELGPEQLGTSANPFQNQVQALQAKIREGASRIELNFPGAGKGSSQQPTPEDYGARERQDIRELARATGVKTTTHATFGRQGFSGFDPQRGGFNDQMRYENVKEMKKAIEFAAEATTGGAVVFHTGEWNRPMSETWGKGQDPNAPDAQFQAFDEEHKRAAYYIVDQRTGEYVSTIRKDKELFRPKFQTAKDLGLVGQYDEKKGGELEPDDYVDINHKWINETDQSRLFERLPVWDRKNTKFEVEKYNWEKVVAETEKWNRKHPEEARTPEQMFIQIEIENQILQAKGHSLFYAQRYEEEEFMAKKLREAMQFYEKLDKSIPEDEKWKLMTERGFSGYGGALKYTTPDSESIPDQIARQLKEVQDRMRHTHEASAAADAQAAEREETLNNLRTLNEYGLKQSAEGVARAGLFAYEQTEKNKANLDEPIYIAPENWQPEQYGSHPDELTELVKASRQEMAQQLMTMRGKSQDEAKRLASQHIKSTIDIGHLNLWRSHFVSKPGESEEQRNKRFNQWAIGKTKQMIKEGIVGHVHIADNLGWDDAHLTAGDGNAPIREFVAELEKAGFKDFIVEPGSFNPLTALPDTLKYLGSPVYASGMPSMTRPMGQFRHAHFGYSAPSNYIVGAYAPSNEWKLWSEVPLE